MDSDNLKNRNLKLAQIILFIVIISCAFAISRDAFAHPSVLDVGSEHKPNHVGIYPTAPVDKC